MDIETMKEGQAEQLSLLCKMVTVLSPQFTEVEDVIPQALKTKGELVELFENA